jgi:outer membrane protein TolC
MRPLFLLVFASIGLLPSISRAEVVTLEALEERILQLRTFDADEARLQASAAEIRKAAAAYYPQVSLNGEANVAPGRKFIHVLPFDPDRPADYVATDKDTWLVQGARTVGTSGAFTPQFRYGADLSVTAQLYDFGRTKAAIHAGQASQRAVGTSTSVARENLIHSLREAYLTWLTVHEQTRLAALARDDAAKRLGRVRGLVGEGVRPRSDVAPAETEVLVAELELSRNQGDLADARLALEHLLGEPLSPQAEPDMGLLERELPPDLAERTAQDRSLARQQEAAYATAKAAQKQLLPVLSVGGSTGFRVQSGSAFPNYSAGLKLAVPLWDGGYTKATAAASRARGDELGAHLREERREREFELDRTRKAVTQFGEQLTLARALHEQCQKRLLESEQGYDAGALVIEQVYQARAMLRRAESEVLLVQSARTKAVLSVLPVRAGD